MLTASSEGDRSTSVQPGQVHVCSYCSRDPGVSACLTVFLLKSDQTAMTTCKNVPATTWYAVFLQVSIFVSLACCAIRFLHALAVMTQVQ